MTTPTEQEWTAENVLMMLQGSQMNTPYADVANAHNASIAAEQEKTISATADAIELEAELAAEQKLSKHWYSEFSKLREQLAAAQKQIEMDTECIERIRNHGMKLEAELSAAVEALEKIRRAKPGEGRGELMNWQEIANCIDAALANGTRWKHIKLGEGNEKV